MDPSQPTEPAQPAAEEPASPEPAAPAPEPAAAPTASEPPVQWQPSVQADAGEGPDGLTGELLGNKPAAALTLGDALSTGLSIVTKPTFIIPVLVIGIVVNAVVNVAFRPLLTSTVTTPNDLSGEQVAGLLSGVLASVLVGLIGGILLNLYGQIWAVEATSGPLPTTNRVIDLARARWIGVIGTGIVVAVISVVLVIGLFLVVGLVAAIAGPLAVLVGIAAFVLYAYVAARLSMAGWLAASGGDISESINSSWRITDRNVLRIVGWGLAYGIVFAVVSGVLGAVLSFVPILGPAVAQSIGAALGYGAGVTLFRRTQAAAMGASSATAAPPAPAVPGAPVGG